MQAKGFRRYVQAGIVLSADQSARNDVTLEIGDVIQEIMVREQASIVEANISEVKYTVDSARIKDIPLAGRNILSLAALMPGVVSGGIPAGRRRIAPVCERQSKCPQQLSTGRRQLCR